MKCIVFDSGPVISLALNNLLWILKELKQLYNGEFILPAAVHHELIETPMQIRRFEFEAFQVNELITASVFREYDTEELAASGYRCMEIANTVFYAKGEPLRIIQIGEAQAIAAHNLLKSDGIVVDERTTRMLIEQPESLRQVLSSRLHTRVRLNKQKLNEFYKLFGKPPVLRSVEIVTVAFEFGLLNRYLFNTNRETRRELLKSSLWALKLKGATVSEKEIEQILKTEKL